jgi:hypothetical protein
MKRLMLFLSLLVLVAAPLSAQDAYSLLLNRWLAGETVASHQAAEDVNVALVVGYKGTSESALVAVAAGGDITFTSGTESSEVADTTLECPVSGDLGGIIDVSDGDCDTLGEVVDIINGADSDWYAVILDGVRTDSSNDTLLLKSAAAATAPGGLNLEWDTDVADHVTFALTDLRDLTWYVGGTAADPQLLVNPFRSRRAVVYEVNYNINFGTAGTLSILSVDPDFRNGSETVTTIFADGATDASETLFDRKPFGITARKDEKLLVRFSDTGTIAGVTLAVGYGNEWRDIQ